MRKHRLFIVLAVICLLVMMLPVMAAADWQEVDGFRYYYLENGDPAQDFLQIDGTWYFFYSDGSMATDCVVWSDVYEGYYALSENGKQHKRLDNGWTLAYGAYYYMTDGNLACDEILKIDGKYYAFRDDCTMADDELLWVDGSFCAAKKGGALYTNSWYQDEYGDWYYFGAEGKGYDDFVKINGTWFFFDDGYMRYDRGVYSELDKAFYALSPDGYSYTLLKKGWTKAYGEWYYLFDDPNQGILRLARDEALQVGGNWYHFDYDAKMSAGEKVYAYVDGVDGYYVADSNGILKNYGWYEEYNEWRYMRDGSDCYGGIYEIDGSLYAFDGSGVLYTLGGEQNVETYDETLGYRYGECFVTDGSGALWRNRWRNRLIVEAYELGWVYYGEDGFMVCDQAKKIGGVWYVFDEYGVMRENEIAVVSDGIYIVGANGVAKKLNANTWYEDKEIGVWYRTDADGNPAEGILKIGTGYYGFSSGEMIAGGYSWGEINGNAGYYLFKDDGELYTKKGWVQVYGNWYYVQSDGTLMNGWLVEGSIKYYMWPEMRHDALFWEDETCWYVNGKGHCKEVSVQNGLNRIEDRLFFVESGAVVKDTWKRIGGYWYYFNNSGIAVKDDYWYIDGVKYIFDDEGRMQTGWIAIYNSWYYAGADGKVVTGLQTIGGTKYLFNSEGVMYADDVIAYDGASYLVDNGGVVKCVFEGTGWKKYNGDWYYCMDGEVLTNVVRRIDGKCYGFDEEGVMLSGGIGYTYWDYYVFADSGEILTGWRKVNGKWVYADPESSDPCLCTGSEYINGKRYVFDRQGFLMIGSFTYDGTLWTTDADGAVIKSEEAPDGWYHYGNNWYYTKNGNGVTGWVGDFYCEYGRMWFCETVEYNGNMYYLQADGSCLRNGWAECNGQWVYARADGSLYCSTWLQQGKNWYYFDGMWMATGRIYIGNEYHEFDENGIWQGEIESSDWGIGDIDVPVGLADGTWYRNKSTGKWYYYHGGYPVIGDYYIDGNHYFFDYFTGEMVANDFAILEFGEYCDLQSRYYYGANGAAAKYTGWKYLKGQWYFFGEDNRIRLNTLLKDSSGYYYAYWDYEDGYSMVKNQASIIEGKLYIFNSAGLARSATTQNGWHKANGLWYYIEAGAPVDGYRVIDGKGYYFYDGEMADNTLCYVNGRTCYFGKGGAMVTAKGWYNLGGDTWIYVSEFGEVYEDGIYFIGGVQYTFKNGIWVQ